MKRNFDLNRITGIGPPCPDCGTQLDLIYVRAKDVLFYGCPKWPECQGLLFYDKTRPELKASSLTNASEAVSFMRATPAAKLGRKAVT